MPELPEVENVKNGLKELIVGKTVVDVRVLWSNIIAEPSISDFQNNLRGQKIEDIQRRGKFLLFVMTDYVMISHLRMEGKYHIEPSDAPVTKHTHVIFAMHSKEELRYLDVRKFGKMSLVDKTTVHLHPSIMNLGPEPTSETLQSEHLMTHLKRTGRPIKACLLDQKIVAGIGNIYADEILYDAGIHPERKADSLDVKEIECLRDAIITIMTRAVEKGGTTIRTYSNAFGIQGNYQSFLKVYGKENEACPKCHHKITKIKVAQRGTHYCPQCQKVRS